MYPIKTKLLSLLCSLCMLLSLFAVFPVLASDYTTDNTLDWWNLMNSLYGGYDLNGESSTSRFTVWEIVVDGADDTTGNFVKMKYENGFYVDATTEDLTHAKFSSTDKDGYVSPGRNGYTGKEAHVAVAFTAPETGTYALDVKFTTYPGWGANWVPQASSAPSFYTVVRSENTEANDVELKKQSTFTFDVNGENSQENLVLVQLKAGETVYYVSAANGEALHDQGYYRNFMVYWVNRDYTEPEEEEVVTPPPALDTYWSLADYNYLQTDLNSSASKEPMSIWQRNIEKGATTGEFMKMNFNGSKKYSDASGEDLSGACLEDMHFCPGRNGASGKEANVGIAFTAPTDGTYELYVNMKKSWLPAIDPDSPPRYYTMKGQDGAEENVFFYDDPTGGSLEKTITFELKKGETLYFFCDTDGSRTDRKDDIYLSAFKVTLTSYEITEEPDAPVADYTATLTGPATGVTVGDKVTFTVNVDKTFASGEVTLSYNELLTPVAGDGIKVNGDGTVTVVVYGDDKTSIDVAFTATAAGTAEAALVKAAFSTKEEAANEDLTAAAVDTTAATVVVAPAAFIVTLPDIFEGNSAVANGSDYTFEAKDTNNYNYSLPTATMGGQTVEVVDNGDGTYTVANVTGELVITGTRTAKTYDVTINDEAAEDATYGVDYEIVLPDDVAVDGATPGTMYTLGSITIGGTAYTGYTTDGRKVTIPGTAITGDIVVTINETTVNPEQFTVTVNKDAAVSDLEYETTATAGVDYTFSFNGKGGFTYTVTATVNGEAVTLTDGQGGAYTIAAADVTGDIVITITATLDLSNVTVNEYVQLDGTKMWLVSIADWNLEEGYRYTYNGEAMYIYNGKVVYLVVADSLTLDDAKALIAVEDGTAEALAATNDVNKSGKVDANDAQLVYNMYNACYADFTAEVTMEKFLLADVNNDGKLDTKDAVAVVSAVLANA